MSCCGQRRAQASTRASTSLQPATLVRAPIAMPMQAAAATASPITWVECRFEGRSEMRMRGLVSGTQYHLRPQSTILVHPSDWPVLRRTGLLSLLVA